MKIKDAKTYCDYFVIKEIDNTVTGFVAEENGRLYHTQYLNDDKNILIFYERKEVEDWIKKHTYKGISSSYSIAMIECNKRWEVCNV